MADEKARSLMQRYEQLRSDRTQWESHWEEIAERVIPRQKGGFTGEQNIYTRGEKRTQKMFDSTAAIALDRFAAVMESMLTPRNQMWHKLKASDPVLNRSRRVRLWFDEVSRVLFQHRYRPKAAFGTNQHETYISLGAFGTGGQFIDENPDGGIRYKACNLSDLYIATNFQGQVDTVFRPFWYTARQAHDRWGPDRLSPKLLADLAKQPDKPYQFLHVVMPRQDADRSKLDYRGMPFASCYIECETRTMVSEGGYRTFPFAISRYVTAPEEMYGRSPAMMVLPAIKTLNEEKKTVLKQGHRTVDPVLLAHDDGVLDSFSMKPGAINYGGMSKEGRPLVGVLPTGNIAIGKDLMDDERMVINDAFLVTLFQILVETPQMTATEVLERTREKGALISPTMSRQQEELLGPMIERELDVLASQGMLPEMPPELVEAEGEYEVEYDSPLSRAQRAEEASGALRSIEFAMGYAAQTGDVSPLDHFDMDVITPEIMMINGVPERWRASAEKVETMREGRRQQAQAQEMIEAAPAVAGLAKAAGNAG